MLTHEDICQAVAQVAAIFPVKQVFYFGSYAEGRQTETSDLDLLIEFRQSAVSIFVLSAIKNTLEDLLKISVDIVHAPVSQESLLEIKKTVQVYDSE